MRRAVRAVRAFANFWLDFVVGDDWRLAAGVGVVLVIGAWLVHDQIARTGVVAVGVGATVVLLAAASILVDARRMSR
jgi:hypothetical protein